MSKKEQETQKQPCDMHGVVGSKAIHAKLLNKLEDLEMEYKSINHILNVNKGMSNDYIYDKASRIPFIRAKIALIKEILD